MAQALMLGVCRRWSCLWACRLLSQRTSSGSGGGGYANHLSPGAAFAYPGAAFAAAVTGCIPLAALVQVVAKHDPEELLKIESEAARIGLYRCGRFVVGGWKGLAL